MLGKFLKDVSQKISERSDARNFSKTAQSAFGQTTLTASFLKSGGTNVYAQYNGKVLAIKGDVDSALESPQKDQREYFDGALKVFHTGEKVTRQHPGASLPAARASGAALDYTPFPERSWQPILEEAAWVDQKPKRRPERQIMGKPAGDVLEHAGLGRQKNAPWAHTQPDHAIQDAELREDRRLRVPTFQGANQSHSAFEMAAKATGKQVDDLTVSAQVGEPIGGKSGLPSGIRITYAMKSRDGTQQLELSHFQNNFVHEGARFGDEKAITQFVMDHKKMLDEGALSAEKDDGTAPYMRIRRLNASADTAQNEAALPEPPPTQSEAAIHEAEGFNAELDQRADRDDGISR